MRNLFKKTTPCATLVLAALTLGISPSASATGDSFDGNSGFPQIDNSPRD